MSSVYQGSKKNSPDIRAHVPNQHSSQFNYNDSEISPTKTHAFDPNTRTEHPQRHLSTDYNHPSIKNHLTKQNIGDEAIEMIEEIQRKALLSIESLRREKAEMQRMFNEEAAAHALEKKRRAWVEDQIQRLIAFFTQKGFKIGQLQYPPWYNMTQPVRYDQFGNGHLGNTVIAQQSQNNFYSPTPNNTQQQYYPKKEVSPSQGRQTVQEMSQHSPSFASQNQQQYPPQAFGQSGTLSNVMNQMNGGQYIPGYQARNQNLLNYNKIPIRDSYEQVITGYPSQNQYPSFPQQQRQQEVNRSYDQLKHHLNELRMQNEYLKQNYSPEDDPAYLKHRLEEAEIKSAQYGRQMERWRAEAEKRGQYPDLLHLLEEGERIRLDTLRLIRNKEINSRRYISEEGNRQGLNSRKGKSSFETDLYSGGNEYSRLVEEMKRVGRS